MRHPLDDFAEDLDGPIRYTYTARLPFALGIPDELGHTIRIHEPYADTADQQIFGPLLTVDIRVFTLEEAGLPMWPPGMHEALGRFYEHDFEDDPAARYGEDSLSAHHQWITLETPAAPGVSELERDDPGFAFHRCIFALNLFLRGVQAATADVRIRPVTSHDLRPVVTIGALGPDGSWRFLNSMLMHPEARPDVLPPPGGPITEDQLNAGLTAVTTGKPYLATVLWRSRAQRALRQRGDPADAIISFQVAAESLLFDTYRMLLIDEGLSSAELEAELEGELPFRSLLTNTMPGRLGGRWDVTRAGSAVGEYWEQLYLVRNAVVHAGLDPHGGHAEAAQRGYWRLRDHLEERLLAKTRDFPRTVLARFGADGLQQRGRLTRRLRRFAERAEAESAPWYWPWDAAGRDRSA